MAVYELKEVDKQIIVTQWSVSLVLFGLIALVISSILIFLLLRDTPEILNTNFWIPLIVSLSIFFFGVYAAFQPFRFEAVFDSTKNQFTATLKGFIKSSKYLHSYAKVTGFLVAKSDNDGYWYQPMLVLKNKSQRNFGFGYGVEEPVYEIVKKLNHLIDKTDNA